jgi:hypothetical protein
LVSDVAFGVPARMHVMLCAQQRHEVLAQHSGSAG